MDNEERDELDAIGDPDLLKLLLRRERTDAAAKEAALQEELETLRTAMRPRLEQATEIHPADITSLPSVDHRMELWEKVRRGELRISESAPRRPKPPVKFMTRKQYEQLPLDERGAAGLAILRGEVKLL